MIYLLLRLLFCFKARKCLNARLDNISLLLPMPLSTSDSNPSNIFFLFVLLFIFSLYLFPFTFTMAIFALVQMFSFCTSLCPLFSNSFHLSRSVFVKLIVNFLSFFILLHLNSGQLRIFLVSFLQC